MDEEIVRIMQVLRNTKEAFISNLRRMRKAKYPSQENFARDVGLSERGYQKYEQGESQPTPEILDRFSKALNCQPWDLLMPEGLPELLSNRPAPRELRALIEAPGSSLPYAPLAQVLAEFANAEPEIRASTLAVLYGDSSIAAPYLQVETAPAKPKKR